MKKFFVIILSALLLTSCISIKSDGFIYSSNIYGDSLAEVSIIPQGGTSFTKAYVVTVRNVSKSTIYVDWANSSISYNGQSYAPFLEGKLNMVTSKDESVSSIEPGAFDVYTIYSSEQLALSSNGYEFKDIPTSSSIIDLVIGDKTESTHYNFNITREAHKQNTIMQKYI